MLTPAESAALDAAFAAAAHGLPGYDPNPPVGCAILDADQTLAAVAAHQGSGTPHAEVAALHAAGAAARGGTAVVTLQPCAHTGRTGPCVEALLDAGISRVVYAVADLSGHAAGGDERLRAAGVEVSADADTARGAQLLGTWGFAQRNQRPHVTWKVAASLDGQVVDAAGASTWITGEAARARVHELRSTVGAVLTGTGTVLADDPRLTARDAEGEAHSRQPLRVVMGMRDIPDTAAVAGGPGELLHLRTHDIPHALDAIWKRGIHSVLLECGPRLAGAAVGVGVVDEVLWFTAGLLLGQGQPAAEGMWQLAQAQRWHLLSATAVGADLLSHWRTGDTPMEEV